jgi:hypothetical protein
MTEASKSERIRALNDELRRSFVGGRVFLTAVVNDLPAETRAEVLTRVQTFRDFTEDNDPHGEHDFGNFEVGGTPYCFKVDYYTPDLQQGSDDPSDEEKTARVLTIMRVDEY